MKLARYAASAVSVITKPLRPRANILHCDIEVTNHCNLSCSMCTRELLLASGREPAHMGIDDFRMVIDQARPLHVTFPGLGEPALNPALPDMVAHLSRRGIRSDLISNGTTLTRELVSELGRAGLSSYQVSLDAPGAETSNSSMSTPRAVLRSTGSVSPVFSRCSARASGIPCAA